MGLGEATDDDRLIHEIGRNTHDVEERILRVEMKVTGRDVEATIDSSGDGVRIRSKGGPPVAIDFETEIDLAEERQI